MAQVVGVEVGARRADKVTNRHKLAQGYRWEPTISGEREWVGASDVQIGDWMCVPRPRRSASSVPSVIDLADFVPADTDRRRYTIDQDSITEITATNTPYPHSIRAVSAESGLSRNAIASALTSATTDTPRTARGRAATETMDRLTTHLRGAGFDSINDWSAYVQRSCVKTRNTKRFISVDEDFCRLLGMWASNRWTRSRGDGSVGFAERRSSAVDTVPTLVGLVFGAETKPFDHARSDLRQWTVLSAPIARMFESLAEGYAHTAHTKALPSWVVHLDQERQLALLGGLWWGDGSTSGGRWAYSPREGPYPVHEEVDRS